MLKELIDQFYLDKQKDKEQHHFYITDAGKCPRAIFFKFKNVPREAIEPNVLRMFDHGDHIHNLIMKPLLSIKEIHVVASEVNIPPQELISGRADAIISDGKNLYVLDIKSMNSMIFKNLLEPKEENINQVQLYLHFFKVPKGILLYVSKDNQQLKEFIIDYDRELALSLLAGLTDLKTKINSDIIPDRIPTYPEEWQCQYCQFKEICKIAGEDEVKWSAFKNKVEN
jgi:CRISPR/Cas system-associated exonuclease Cas4 (RecB family)